MGVKFGDRRSVAPAAYLLADAPWRTGVRWAQVSQRDRARILRRSPLKVAKAGHLVCRTARSVRAAATARRRDLVAEDHRPLAHSNAWHIRQRS